MYRAVPAWSIMAKVLSISDIYLILRNPTNFSLYVLSHNDICYLISFTQLSRFFFSLSFDHVFRCIYVSSQQQTVMAYMHQNDRVNRQLHLLQ